MDETAFELSDLEQAPPTDTSHCSPQELATSQCYTLQHSPVGLAFHALKNLNFFSGVEYTKLGKSCNKC